MNSTELFKKNILKLMRGVAFSPYTKLYLGLFRSSPGNSGTEGYEVSYTGYARKEISFRQLNEDSSSLTISNSSKISFPKCNQFVGLVNYIGILDNSASGNVLFYEELDSPLDIQSGDIPTFQIGSVEIIFSGNLSQYYRKAIVNALTGKGGAVSGFTPYVGLCYRNTLNNLTEFSGSPYTRMTCAVSDPIVQQDNSILSQNTSQVIVNLPSAKNEILTDVCFYNSETGGQMYCYIPLKETDIEYLNTQTTITFPAASLRFFVN